MVSKKNKSSRQGCSTLFLFEINRGKQLSQFVRTEKKEFCFFKKF